ncbi:dihydrodipicolinate synthase family protein [Candidatus Halobeggiatoa sp. HSG11]|nr:dihydrodipicolinate synthase family protein [Candidatus Halobeggiatoa sp. HSG11]
MNIIAPIFAIVTPFFVDGKIDFESLGKYLIFLQERKVKTILTNGTTAEFPSLSIEERMELLEYCHKVFDGTILNNISSCCQSDCLRLAYHAESYSDGLVILPPFYNANLPEAGITSFLSKILEQTDMPTFLYNFPKHTNNKITPTMAKFLLTKHDNLVGIKDSSGDLKNAAKFKEIDNFQVFVGSDSLALKVLSNGLNGSVSGGGNVFPELVIAIPDYFHANNLAKAKQAQVNLDVWNKLRKQYPSVAVTKAALSTRIDNFPPFVRSPLTKLSDFGFEQIATFMKNHKLLIDFK